MPELINNPVKEDLSQKLSLLLINTEEPFLFIDRDYKIIAFNESIRLQYIRSFGITLVKGSNILDLAPPGRAEFLKVAFVEILNGKKIESEIQVPSPDGSYRTVIAKYKPALDETGKIIGIFISPVDITEKLELQKIQQGSEKRFQALLENASEVISLTKMNGDVIYVSPAIEKVTGFTPKEIIEKACFLRMHPDQVPESKKVLEKLLQNPGVPIPRINRFLHKNGHYVWMEGLVINLLDDPNVGAIVSNYRDITQRKLAEEKLKESESNLRAIFDNSTEAFTLLDKDCNIIAFNSKANENDLLMSRHLEVGKNLMDYVDADRQSYLKEYTSKVLAGEVIEYETRYIQKDGTVLWFFVTMSPAWENNVITGLCITRHDITRKKIAEEELKESHKLLQKLNERLEKRAEELAMSNSELEQFAYIASHDLQEPLRMVTSFLNLLELKYKGQLDDKAKQYIHFATDGAIRMRKIILDLLEYSMAGKKLHDTETFAVNDLLYEAIQLNRKAIEEKNAVIEWDKLPEITGHRASLQQVFQNLIGNALKYQQENITPLINIKVSETEKYWHFSIKDNGIGIDPIFFEKIFIVFQRLHNKDEYSGTGLGLAICKKIIENHGGKIWVESALGEGSTFHFTILK